MVLQLHQQIDKLKLSYHTLTKYKLITDKLAKQGLEFNNNEIKNTPEQIVKTIENLRKYGTGKKVSDSYKLDFYTCLKALYKYNLLQLTDDQLQAIEKQFKTYKIHRENIDNEKYDDIDITLEQIRHKLSQTETSPQKLVLMLYSYVPARRLEYRNIKILKSKPQNNKQDNYMIFLKKSINMYLNDYKGSDRKGSQEIVFNKKIEDSNVPEDLKQLIPQLVEELQKYRQLYPKNKYLFQTDKGEPLSQQQFSEFVISSSQELLGEKLGVNHFRHLFISTYKSQKNISQKQLEYISQFMCHSMNMQNDYFVLDMARRSIVQQSSLYDFDQSQYEKKGLFNIYQNKISNNYILVPNE